MLVIRLARIGRKHQPHYRVVVAERRSKLGAPPVEDFGFYDPATKKASINKQRIEHWVSAGAQTSKTAHNLFVREGVFGGSKKAIKIRKKLAEEKREATPKAQVATPAAAVQDES